MEDFKIFLDKDLKVPAGNPIDLGKLKAGHTKKFTFYIYNSSVNPHDEINVVVDSSEVSVISFPETMEEKSHAMLILEWKPKINIKQGLKAIIKIESYEVFT